MITSRRRLISSLAAGLAASEGRGSAQAAARAGHASLATRALKVRLEEEHGWALSVADAASGRVFTVSGKSPLFELVLANGDGSETVLSAAEAGDVRVSRKASGLQVEFTRLDGRDIDVICDLREGEHGAVIFGAAIRNGGTLPVRSLRYPIVTLNPRPSADDVYLLMPMMETFGLVRNPHRYLPSAYPVAFKWLRESGLFGRSPGSLAAQFAAYYDSKAGLYTAAYDAKGWRKELAMDLTDGVVRLSWVNFLPEIPATQQKLDYPIVLSSFTGDWYDAADIYKTWARRQPWCAKTLRERDDVPEWIKRGSLWLSIENWRKESDGSFTYYGDHLEKLMERWRALLPQPPVLHYRWTDKYAYAATFLDWKPFFPSDEAYTSTLAEQSRHGVRAWLMINGYNLTLTQGNDGKGGYLHDERARFQQEAAAYAVRDPKGEISHWRLSWIDNGTNVEMCRGTAWAQKFDNDVAERYARLGFSLCQMDQTIGGGGDICYAKDHGHPPGGGTWFMDAFRRQLRTIREIGRRYNPEFSVSQEGPNELFIQELGTYQARDHIEMPFLVFPAEGEMERPWDVRVVPVFTYIYHPYIIGYTSWVGMGSGIQPVPKTEEGWDTVGVTALAKSLIYGKLPGVFERPFTPAAASATKRFRLLIQHAALTGGEERRYLLFGEMLKPPPLRTDTVAFRFQYRYEIRRDYPRVMHSAFQDAGGNRAVFLVNVSDEKTTCTLAAGDFAGARRHVSECRLQEGKVVRTAVKFADALALTLSPLEVMYVEFASSPLAG